MTDHDRARHRAFLFRLELQVALGELHNLQVAGYIAHRIQSPRPGRHAMRHDNLRWQAIPQPRESRRVFVGVLAEQALKHVANRDDNFRREHVRDALNYLTYGVLLSAPQVNRAEA